MSLFNCPECSLSFCTSPRSGKDVRYCSKRCAGIATMRRRIARGDRIGPLAGSYARRPNGSPTFRTDQGLRLSVALEPWQRELFAAIGKGNISEGVRRAAEVVKRLRDAELERRGK